MGSVCTAVSKLHRMRRSFDITCESVRGDCVCVCVCGGGGGIICHTCTLRLLLLTASKFSYFVIFCIFRVLILAILDQYTMILMIFIVIDA